MGRPIEPDGLSARALAIWRSERGRRGRTRSASRAALLLEACRALDRADALAAVVATQGLTVVSKNSGVVHLNPLVALEARERDAFRKMAALLELQWTAGEDGPPLGANGR